MTDQTQAAQVENTEVIENVDNAVQTQSTETEQSAAPAVDTTEKEPKKDDGVQKRINKVTADKWTEKRRADALQKQLDELKASQTTHTAQTVTTTPIMPTEADFDYDADKYNAAMATYNADMVTAQVNQVLSKNNEQQATNAEATRLQVVQDNFWASAEKSGVDSDKFNAALNTLPTFKPDVLEALMSAENAPNVSMYLSEHLDVADTIANSSPVVAAMKIGEISSRLANTTQTNNISNAPDPIDTLNQGGAATGEKDDPRLEGADFV